MMSSNKLFILPLALGLILRVAHAWSINGHLYVANIAQDLLEKNAPEALQAANDLFPYLTAYDPYLTSHEGDHVFVETATFADDNKYHGEGWQADYHFVDLPWIEEGKESDYDIQSNPLNLTNALTNLVSWLSDGKEGTDYQSSSIYTHLMDEFDNDENVAKSYALRLIIHYVGDLVQPLHCETRYDSEFPTGDKGGNFYPLQYHYDVDELHALWDKILYDGYHNIARPFTEDTWTSFQTDVDSVMSTYAYAVADASVYETIDFDAMSQESFLIAETLYDGLVEDEPVPQAYLDKFKPVAYERLIIGGYRLAYLVNFMFGDNSATFRA